MVSYVNVDSSELIEILQGELLKRIENKKIPNNPKGLALLEKNARQVCKDVLTEYVSENVNIIVESKGKHSVHIHWLIPEEEDCIDKEQ